jgi:hypothetical protein
MHAYVFRGESWKLLVHKRHVTGGDFSREVRGEDIECTCVYRNGTQSRAQEYTEAVTVGVCGASSDCAVFYPHSTHCGKNTTYA